MLKQKLKNEGYSIYKLAGLTTKIGSKEHARIRKWLERILNGKLLTEKKKNEFIEYFYKIKLGHLIDDNDFEIVYIKKFKIK